MHRHFQLAARLGPIQARLAIHLTKGGAKACVIAVEDGCEDSACDQADEANSRVILADDRYYATSPMDDPAGEDPIAD